MIKEHCANLIIGVFVVKFHISILSFYCWLWTSRCPLGDRLYILRNLQDIVVNILIFRSRGKCEWQSFKNNRHLQSALISFSFLVLSKCWHHLIYSFTFRMLLLNLYKRSQNKQTTHFKRYRILTCPEVCSESFGDFVFKACIRYIMWKSW